MAGLHLLTIYSSVLMAAPWRLVHSTIVIGYLGPNTLLPLASILAAVVGFVLMFWGVITKTIRRTVRRITRRGEQAADVVPDEPMTAPDDDVTKPSAKE